jgi:hypothetical protein
MCKAKEYSENLIKTYNSITEDVNHFKGELRQVTLYEQDILHIIEMGGFNASEGYKLAKMLCDNRQKRRKIKNELEPLISLKSKFVDKNINQLNTVCQSVARKEQILNELTENKVYNPRTLNTTDIKEIITNKEYSPNVAKPIMRHKRNNQHIISFMQLDKNILYAQFKNGTRTLIKLKDVVDFDESKRVENYYN